MYRRAGVSGIGRVFFNFVDIELELDFTEADARETQINVIYTMKSVLAHVNSMRNSEVAN